MNSKKLFFHVDHVGSLLRPPELHKARADARQGKIKSSALRAIEDKCIKKAVAIQEGIGLKVVTDGEFRRDWWHIDFLHGFQGVDLADSGDVYRDASFKDVDEQPPTMEFIHAAAISRAASWRAAATTSSPTLFSQS